MAHTYFALLSVSFLFALIHLSSAVLTALYRRDLHRGEAERDKLIRSYFSMGLNYSDIFSGFSVLLSSNSHKFTPTKSYLIRRLVRRRKDHTDIEES